MLWYLEKLKNMFTFDEILFMVDALNGVHCSPETLGANLWGWVPYAGKIADKIKPNLLLGKVSSLPPNKVAQLHTELEAFWADGNVEDIHEQIVKTGLTKWMLS